MLKISRHRTWTELLELEQAWNPVLSRSAADTVFLTWQWLNAWWKNYGKDRTLFVLAAWERNELVGVAPLYSEDASLYGTTCRRLRLIGDGSHDSDYLDCFAERGREAEVMNAFARSLEADRRSWDWIELNGPKDGSPCLAAALKFAGDRKWGTLSAPIRCATLPLPNSWENYLNSLQPRFRSKVRSSLTALDECVKSTPAQCDSEKQIDPWLSGLFDLHTRRWQSRGQSGVFVDPVKRSFYHDLSRSALQEGWLAFHCLSWGEHPLATQYGLVYRNRFHLLQEGYDPDFSDLRPGVGLRAWLMRHWIERGLQEYDFLAGVSDYKRDWGAQEKLATRMFLAARRTRSLVALDIPRWSDRAHETVAQLAPASLLSLRKAMRSQRPSVAPSSPEPNAGFKQTIRRLVSSAYSGTALGQIGRSLASTYAWNPRTAFYPLRRRSQPVCHILQYHRVNDDHDPFLGGLPAGAFRAQMRHLAAHFPFLTLDQLARGEFPGGHKFYVAVTFDDGYRDNFLCAFPVLKELGIPATIFLATGYVNSGDLPWYDQVRLAFKLSVQPGIFLPGLTSAPLPLNNRSERVQAAENTLHWLRGLPQNEWQSAVAELYRALRVPTELKLPNQMLSWDDVRQMSRHNISFGAHTVTHPVLSRISTLDLDREIAGSKRAIEDRLQTPVSHFAYPFGQPLDFNSTAKRSVINAGFKTAVTTVWGLNGPNEDRFELKRFSPWETNIAEFKIKLDWYRLRMSPNEVQETTPIVGPGIAQEAGI
ncbi:MAG TPA: GNAT family N-acetyltransferase [Candidatus Binatia bacterium]|nr:GNAT family N-acetyltransferase [Candidatus Binatia bacterium]